jgi:hypothetical protein
MVKGLARFRNRLRHDRMAKHVDAGTSQEGGYSPMTARFYPRIGGQSMCAAQPVSDRSAVRSATAADR